MGCCSSSSPSSDEGAPPAPDDDGDDRGALVPAGPSTKTTGSAASEVGADQHKRIHERLLKLQELDEATKIPFILVELRGLGDHDGYVEICGKDEYGVHAALDEWLTTMWSCKKLDAGDLSEDTQIPFCDALYRWENFKVDGHEGLNNMGLATMHLVDFMTNQLTWTLGVVNGGNVGEKGEIREQQVIFKAPHPMNMVANHCMIELRSAGYIEICGEHCGISEVLEEYLGREFKATKVGGHEDFCDIYYECGDGVFKERGKQGECNLGQLTTKLCDAMVEICPGWSLNTMNGGNYGEGGTHREQQLVFRWDNHPLQKQPHMLIELREAGYVEICGQNVGGIYDKLESWLKSRWGCGDSRNVPGQDPFYDKKYTWKAKDFMVASAELVGFFHKLGWQLQVCSQGTVRVKGNDDCREQQLLFRPGASDEGVLEPHLFIELYMGEGDPALYADETKTQMLANQWIRMAPVGDCSSAIKEFHGFVTEFLGGVAADNQYSCEIFMGRGHTDNNLGCWTMRICDFMVDRLGWSFVVCNVCNMGQAGQFREQQLVFRYDGERREIPVTRSQSGLLNVDRLKQVAYPSYWKIPEVLNFEKAQAVVACDVEEIASLQAIFDYTFRRVLTRDRVYEYQATSTEEMPYRLVIVHAFRSENSERYRTYAERYAQYPGGTPFKAKTLEAPDSAAVNSRLNDGEGLLFHGTNPSSAMAILKTGFNLSAAGKSTGTMFGYGIYLAECVSKSDEYARDDGGGTYPRQLAMLVCRSLIGNPFIVHNAGDYLAEAKEQGMDCIVGDRETKVNTYKEYVFFDERQVLPEYTVIYRREYDQSVVPQSMKTKTSGTTGRSWQVKLDKGFANIPPNVNKKLLDAAARGEAVVEVEIGEFKYTFDLDAKTQTNLGSGMVRNLRAPMVK